MRTRQATHVGGGCALAGGLLLVLAGALRSEEPARKPAGPLEYNRDVRPILSGNCFRCHGPDPKPRQADLRLDLRDVAVRKKAIVPGKPEESEIVRRIFSTSPDEVMPPPASNKVLEPREKEVLREWIAQGAAYQPHWAYMQPVRRPPPDVKAPAWVRNPIDAFILEKIEARGLVPVPEADRRTLARRLSLDLVGLPPSLEEVDAFASDSSAEAYERLVERLLASPHYGERMAIGWLDLVRFADTVGYHGDQNQNVFPYRDYVIDSFNENKPFDRFTIEQIAGDLLPNATPREIVATGFNRLNMMTREGGAQPGEYLAKYAADRVRTVGMTWLGSTLGCAECHDHKFDPFTTRDFYRLSAFFADVRQWGVYQDYGYTPNPDLRGWTNEHPFPPEIVVESPYLQRRIARLEDGLATMAKASGEALRASAGRREALEAWRASSVAFLAENPEGWAVLRPGKGVSAKEPAEKRAGFSTEADGSFIFDGKPKDRVELDLEAPAGWIAAIRLELLPHEKHGGSVIRGGGADTTVKLSAALEDGAGKEKPLPVFHADADRKEERYSNGHAILGVADAWKTSSEARTSPHTAVWILEKPLRLEGDAVIRVTIEGAVGRARISVTPFAAREPLRSGGGRALLAAFEKEPPGRSAEEGRLLDETCLLGTDFDPAGLEEARKVIRDIYECRGGRSPTLVTAAEKPRVTRVLRRGNWQDESGDVVEPGTPAFLEGPRPPEGGRLGRLDLARWLVSRENPLTARTVVNRLWRQFFGTGLSAVVDDLGAQGETPSHPELLDWLAVELVETGWDLKHMVRLMVESATYRQSSNPGREAFEIDPANRLLASQSPRRLEAELIRDNALAIAGLLDGEIGGPSAFPYQPAGYYVNIQFPDRDYYPNRDERQYRRGIYTHWQRTFLHPMLANFDAPSREECWAYRIVSNTPQQALTLLNDPTFVEAARVFARRLIEGAAGDDAARIDLAFRRALARPARDREKVSLLALLEKERAHYRVPGEEAAKLLRVGNAPPPPGDAAEHAAWTSVCRVILNLHETLTRY